MDPEVEKALEDFVLKINDLMIAHGEDEVLAELESLMPFLEDQGVETPTLSEYVTQGAKLGQAVAKPGIAAKALDAVRKVPGAKWVEDKLKKWLVPAGLLGASTAADAATTVAGKYLDQDVSLTDIETDKTLNVRSASLEDMLKNANDSLEKMSQVLLQTQQQIANKLDGVDASVDDMVAAETGETSAQVQSRQQAGVARPTSKKAAAPKKKKAEKDIKPPTVKN